MNNERPEPTTGFRRYRAVVILIFLLICMVSGMFDDLYNRCYGNRTRVENATYLEDITQKAASLLVPIMVAKGSMDVIEGSEMVLEFGDIVQPLLDYLNVAWQVVLVASIVLLSFKYFLEGTIDIGSVFLTVSVAMYLLLALFHSFRSPDNPVAQTVKRMAGMMLLIALLIYFVLPLSVQGAAWLSQHSTANMTVAYEETFDELSKTFALDTVESAEGMKQKAELFKDKADELILYVQDGGLKKVGKSAVYVMVVYILDGIVYPVLMMFFLIWFIRGALYPALGLANETKG
jgi:hypothetical protein